MGGGGGAGGKNNFTGGNLYGSDDPRRRPWRLQKQVSRQSCLPVWRTVGRLVWVRTLTCVGGRVVWMGLVGHVSGGPAGNGVEWCPFFMPGTARRSPPSRSLLAPPLHPVRQVGG